MEEPHLLGGHLDRDGFPNSPSTLSRAAALSIKETASEDSRSPNAPIAGNNNLSEAALSTSSLLPQPSEPVLESSTKDEGNSPALAEKTSKEPKKKTTDLGSPLKSLETVRYSSSVVAPKLQLSFKPNSVAAPLSPESWILTNNGSWPQTITIFLDQGRFVVFDAAKLKSSSNYFARALAPYNTFIESQTGIFRISGIKPLHLLVFKHFIDHSCVESTDYLLPQTVLQNPPPAIRGVNLIRYQGFSTYPAANEDVIFKTALNVRLENLVECYLLGVYLHAPGFQNAMIDEIFHAYFNYPGEAVPLYNIVYICESTTSKNPLRRLLVDFLEKRLPMAILEEAAERGLIPEDIFEAFGCFGKTKNENFGSNDLCQESYTYHVHPKGSMRSPCLHGWCDKGIEQEKWAGAFVEQDVQDTFDYANHVW